MQNKLRIHAAAIPTLSLALFVSACGEQQQSSLAPEVSNPPSASEQTSQVESTPSRITSVNRALNLSGGDALGSSKISLSFFIHRASVSAPALKDGRLLQATNFASSKSLAVVSYALAGPEAKGALEWIDISSSSKPQILSQMMFDDIEFADVAIFKNLLIAVGAKAELGAYALVIDQSDIKNPKVVSEIQLPGYYALDVDIQESTASITTGDNGGLVSLNLENIEKLKASELIKVPFALSSLFYNEMRFILGGEKTQIMTFDDRKIESLASVASTALESPGRMAASRDILAVNAGHSGLQLYSIDDCELRFLGRKDIDGTGNGLALSENKAYLAQGEAGLQVFDISNPKTPSFLGKFDFTDDAGSANQIAVFPQLISSLIFIADGKGGFRIVESYVMTATPVTSPYPSATPTF